MAYDPARHRRRSIRLKGYDYSGSGAYFVTICIQGGHCILGDVVAERMQLNQLGLIVRHQWLGLPRHYPHVILDEFVVMPNHFHGILWLVDRSGDRRGDGGTIDDDLVRAGFGDQLLAGTDNLTAKPAPTIGGITNNADRRGDGGTIDDDLVRAGFGDQLLAGTDNLTAKPAPTIGGITNNADRHGLPEILRGFKTFSARSINRLQKNAGTPVWQRNYYEHIIRDDRALANIRQYIQTNPKNWLQDKFHKQ